MFMEGMFGLSHIESLIVYHISSYEYRIGKVYNTKNNPRREYQNSAKISIEQNAEKCRKEIDEYTLPSRYYCLYVCDEKHLHYWYNQLKNIRADINLKIYRVELCGTILWTYADWLLSNHYCNYWKAEAANHMVQYEGLFCGEYKLLSEHTIDEFDNDRD